MQVLAHRAQVLVVLMALKKPVAQVSQTSSLVELQMLVRPKPGGHVPLHRVQEPMKPPWLYEPEGHSEQTPRVVGVHCWEK